jgi:hypothetical protein
MAEIFGVAAGAIGVVSLSIQLAESLHNVKSFYESVKNAPPQVAELIEEIEIMQDILGDLETGSQGISVASTPTMRRCMKVADGATKRFTAFATELQTRIKKSNKVIAQFGLQSVSAGDSRGSTCCTHTSRIVEPRNNNADGTDSQGLATSARHRDAMARRTTGFSMSARDWQTGVQNDHSGMAEQYDLPIGGQAFNRGSVRIHADIRYCAPELSSVRSLR